ncbi:MAG: hypothetical protein A2504_07525 [Bdellovibrionales bacterium RIFOXYD12_FULL_39_22]|nr:MAG: hypothetical protein A2385_11910 [Bdellovibrionales bacterium RIFOXYB1_FULL_39_21]OFZ43665.1 MAG: hypothetical protein A2485_15855 [Bdellovibrionales bacterium RIFOXYC12_FULL_39_17]OFZ47606.1 MAG: hypothetical protein A2404_01215 [Bdellovibrionales bacterium RIFOXYC1_FULL_39_130]OFZ76126.1 MAG: hypothetical protein A2560_04815 [Bdellovibrionales bacterium RIFOXYD1_FULL_39_84]OFZ95111.1 MAG: hypothetical protein A2504_07525 [Bdellovibrionales bacterium RIFOXYD12_FULL_39_22]
MKNIVKVILICALFFYNYSFGSGGSIQSSDGQHPIKDAIKVTSFWVGKNTLYLVANTGPLFYNTVSFITGNQNTMNYFQDIIENGKPAFKGVEPDRINNLRKRSDSTVSWIIPTWKMRDDLYYIDAENLAQCVYLNQKDKKKFLPKLVDHTTDYTPLLDVSGFNPDLLNGEFIPSKFYTGSEQEIGDWLKDQKDNSVSPIDIFEKAMDLRKGDIFESLLLCHNILRLKLRYYPREDSSLQSYSKKERSSYLSKLKDIRGDKDNGGDLEGAWYHFFGISLYAFADNYKKMKSGVFPSPLKAEMMGWGENLCKILMPARWGGLMDKHELQVNIAGALFGYELFLRYAPKDYLRSVPDLSAFDVLNNKDTKKCEPYLIIGNNNMNITNWFFSSAPEHHGEMHSEEDLRWLRSENRTCNSSFEGTKSQEVQNLINNVLGK